MSSTLHTPLHGTLPSKLRSTLGGALHGDPTLLIPPRPIRVRFTPRASAAAHLRRAARDIAAALALAWAGSELALWLLG